MKLNSTLWSIIVACSIILLACSCKNEKNSASAPVDKQKETSAIHSLMAQQVQAWNGADIEGFMEPYLKTDSLKFIGKRGITYGWQATLDNYRKNYSTPDEMGKLQFNNITTDVMSDSVAFVIGKWQLFRTADTLAGYYTLLWKKVDTRWVIIADHSS